MSMTYCIRKIYSGLSGHSILPIGIVIVGDTKAAINVVIVKIRIESEIEDDGLSKLNAVTRAYYLSEVELNT